MRQAGSELADNLIAALSPLQPLTIRPNLLIAPVGAVNHAVIGDRQPKAALKTFVSKLPYRLWTGALEAGLRNKAIIGQQWTGAIKNFWENNFGDLAFLHETTA